eukprot:574419-Amorphochlora_amoeboformis.AAC.1
MHHPSDDMYVLNSKSWMYVCIPWPYTGRGARAGCCVRTLQSSFQPSRLARGGAPSCPCGKSLGASSSPQARHTSGLSFRMQMRALTGRRGRRSGTGMATPQCTHPFGLPS